MSSELKNWPVFIMLGRFVTLLNSLLFLQGCDTSIHDLLQYLRNPPFFIELRNNALRWPCMWTPLF